MDRRLAWLQLLNQGETGMWFLPFGLLQQSTVVGSPPEATLPTDAGCQVCGLVSTGAAETAGTHHLASGP